jgi:RNA polymerase sigma-70 factor (ECF subfamily)
MHAPTLEMPNPVRCCPESGRSLVAAPRTHDLDQARRVQAGDQTAFQEAVERYQSRIFSSDLRDLVQPTNVDEIAQEVFAKVYFSIRLSAAATRC